MAIRLKNLLIQREKIVVFTKWRIYKKL
jgi:hypothetical protein